MPARACRLEDVRVEAFGRQDRPLVMRVRPASTGRSARRTGRPGGTARSAAPGCGRAPCRPPGPPSAGRSRRRSSRTVGPHRAGSRGPCARRRARMSCVREVQVDPDPPIARKTAPDGRCQRVRQSVRPDCSAAGPLLGATPRTRHSSAAVFDGRHAQPVPGHEQGADRRVHDGVPVDQPDFGQDSRRKRCRGAGQQRRPWPISSSYDHRLSCGHLLALVAVGGLVCGPQHGQAAMDLGLDGALGPVEGGCASSG